MSRSSDVWVFGYGSLIWRPEFAYAERHPAYVEGWTRRFWQGSPDHRGVPEAPGRVVTLVPEAEARCFGAVYRVAPAAADAVLAALDHRERGGYARVELRVHLLAGAGPVEGALMYLATPDNPHFLGPAPLPEIARQIARSHGPSGANREYLQRLAAALRDIGADDDHVFSLERELAALAP
jgi:glutathione-specific gamma-glutamylcyclotransferase